MKRNTTTKKKTRVNDVVSSIVNVPVSRERHEDKYITNQQNLLINEYGKLVAPIARWYQKVSGTLELKDIEQEGMSGLLEAPNSYDPEKGSFDKHAKACIEWSILEAIGNDGSTIRIPEGQNEMLRKVRKVQNDFFVQNGYEASEWEIADKLGVTDRIVKTALSADISCVSLDNSCNDVDDDGDPYTFADLTLDTDSAPTDHRVCTDDWFETAICEIEKLPEFEREIFTLYREHLKYTEVADIMDISRKTVARVVENTRSHLITHLTNL